MKYYIRTHKGQTMQAWMCIDSIEKQEDVAAACCEIFTINHISDDPLQDMMNVPFSDLQEISRDNFVELCNQNNLLSVTNYTTSAESRTSS